MPTDGTLLKRRAPARSAMRHARSVLGVAVLALAPLALALLSSQASGADPLPLSATAPAVTTTEVGAPFFATFAASGGVPPYRWSSTSPLPSGFTLSSKGLLSGIAQSTVSEIFVATVTDATGATASAVIQLVVGEAPTITTSTVPDGVVGVPDSFSLVATGGLPPYSWGVSGGPLPLGLVLNSDGTVTGIPAAAGVTNTTFQLVDTDGSHVSATLRIEIDPSVAPSQGYLVATSTGAVSTFATPGLAVAQTSNDGPPQVAAVSADAAGNAYWVVTVGGTVIASPAAKWFGSVARRQLSGRIVGIAAKPDGSGYWVASSTGRVYGFGSARSRGSVGKRALSGSIVGIAANPEGSGYWLASSNGRIYGFGVPKLPRPSRIRGRVVAIASDPAAGAGLWLVTNLGHVYGYGGVPTFGSPPRLAAGNAAVGIAAAPDGLGYWILTRTGQVEPFGSALAQPAVERGLGGVAVAIAPAK